MVAHSSIGIREGKAWEFSKLFSSASLRNPVSFVSFISFVAHTCPCKCRKVVTYQSNAMLRVVNDYFPYLTSPGATRFFTPDIMGITLPIILLFENQSLC